VRHTEPREHTKEALVPLPYNLRRLNGFIIKTEEEEDRLVCLEKRLEPNVDYMISMTPSKCWILLRYQIFSNPVWV
jgi:hypothetical protein